ncbi:MAG TPA: S53 family peptidase [Candidatus Baltobacterales bacterium]|nr:S53 family peptidase [Candidatus Baltobacterales bacterium]
MSPRPRAAIALALLLGTVLAACGTPRMTASPALATASPQAPPPTLAEAIQRSADLGPARSDTTVYLSFGLRTRQPAKLAALIASGRTISPATYSAEFGPDPVAVAEAVSTLEAAGFRATWQPGSGLIGADGPAPEAASLLDVGIESYRLGDGTTFYASVDQPRLPPPLSAVASSVSGLDDYRRTRSFAVRPGGLTPSDVLAFYNLKPLRDAGLDGAGQTILLPEIDDLPDLGDLDKFATKYGLPPFEPLLTVRRDPSWGSPEKPQGETVLDLEIIHEIAPAAKLVIYLSAPDFGHGDRAFDQMVTDHLGSIISESLGACEPDTPSGHRNTYATIEDRAVALGMSHFVATGDNGAFTCGQDQDPAASFPSTLPTVTAVGGTSIFESNQGVYFKEMAWGSPLDQSGTGGGASRFYPAPDYQKNETQTGGHGMRQVPDVAADADPATGFHIVFGGREGQAGGTSAATPLWAATVALINQDLKKKGLREVGFANPGIYWMGENESKFSARPFHDVTAGNNLGYDAGPGWDFATGWGSMDGAALDAAWALYIKSGGA